MNGLFTHLNLKPNNPITLEALTNKLRERELHFLPDVTIPLNEVRVDNNLNIVLPNSERTFALNAHSKSQLNSLLEFRFDAWFEESSIDVKRDELNTRLKRASSTVKFRLTDYHDTATADGTVAGIVTPGFQPINDSIVTSILGFNIGHNCKILRANITQKSTEYVIAIGSPENNKIAKKTTKINIVAWGKQAENCIKYISKRMEIMCEGKIESESYKDSDGKTRNIVRINASSIVFLEKSNKEDQ